MGKLIKDEKGQVLPMFGILLVLLIGLAAITIDGGRIYQLKNESFNIAEASALSASEYFGDGPDKVKDIGLEYALANGAKSEDVVVKVDYGALIDGVVVDKVTVEVISTYQTIFGKFIGRDKKEVTGKYSVTKTTNKT